MKKKVITGMICATLAGVFLAGCGNSSNSANETTSQVDTTKKLSNDFDGEKIEREIGDYKIKIPAVWKDKDPYYYPTVGFGDDFSMLYLAKDESPESKYDDIDLVLSADSFLEGVTSTIENSEIISKEKLSINGLTVMHAEIIGTVSDRNGNTTLYWLTNPSDGSYSMIGFFQGNGTEFDYTNDIKEVVNSIKPISEKTEIVKTTQETTTETTTAEETTTRSNDIPREYTSALNKAKTYADSMYMSKSGVYDQLTSEYGEGFSAEAAQYAIDNINIDWNYNALKKAQSYQDNMNMSPAAIYQQLVSEYGEKFTPQEAQYAIDHLNK